MVSIYLDACEKLKFGLLSQNYSWMDYFESDTLQSASKIHEVIQTYLESNNLQFCDVQKIFYAAGPGSYTGVRMIEGISQVFRWEGLPTYSFYHFEVPSMLNIESGTWFSNAFKNEWFVHHWDSDESGHRLLNDEEMNKSLADCKKLYCLNDEQDKKLEVFSSMKLESTQKLIYNNPMQLFSKLEHQKIIREPFYFRSVEKEFKPLK